MNGPATETLNRARLAGRSANAIFHRPEDLLPGAARTENGMNSLATLRRARLAGLIANAIFHATGVRLLALHERTMDHEKEEVFVTA